MELDKKFLKLISGMHDATWGVQQILAFATIINVITLILVIGIHNG